jgi:hypothetical protein
VVARCRHAIGHGVRSRDDDRDVVAKELSWVGNVECESRGCRTQVAGAEGSVATGVMAVGSDLRVLAGHRVAVDVVET